MDDDTFAEKLLAEEHVAVVPGKVFGTGGCSSYKKIEEALQRMERFMSRPG